MVERLVNNEFEGLWKEAVVTQFKVSYYLGICQKGLRKTREISAKYIDRSRTDSLTRRYEERVTTTRTLRSVGLLLVLILSCFGS
jgi:hypothetical protein